MISFLIYICLFILIVRIISNNKRLNFNEYGFKFIVPHLDNSKWTVYVDKLLVKDYCKRNNIKTFKTIYVLKDPSELSIIYETLPTKFVVKSNKGSGMNYLVYNKYKTNFADILDRLKNYKNTYNVKYEKQYEYTNAKLYIEELIEPIPADIKIIVFKNRPKILWIDDNRFKKHTRNLYAFENDTLIPLKNEFWHYNQASENPRVFHDIKHKIKELRSIVSTFDEIELDLYRLDLYYHNNEFYFGEVTLSSGAFSENISEECSNIIFE